LDLTVKSFHQYYPDAKIVVADDSEFPQVREDCTVIQLPYDSGLSAGRNALVDDSTTPYLFMTDDDAQVTEATDIQRMYDILVEGDYDIVACRVLAPNKNNRTYQGWIKVVGDELHVVPATVEPEEGVIDVDVTMNTMIAKRESLKNVRWTDSLKVGEHLDFFLKAKDADLKIAYVPSITCLDRAWRSPDYHECRNRAAEFHRTVLPMWLEKYGVKRLDVYLLDWQGLRFELGEDNEIQSSKVVNPYR
jgi:hypothetical protein